MDFEAEAQKDVEATRRSGLKELELAVARARVIIFGACTLFVVPLAGLLLASSGGVYGWRRVAPVGVFGSGLIYALLVRRRIHRTRGQSRFIDLVAFADILVVILSVVLLHTLMSPFDSMPSPVILHHASDSISARFDIYGLAPLILTLLFLGNLRVERRHRIPLIAFGVGGYQLAVQHDTGFFEVQQLLAAVVIAIGGALGAKTSDRIEQLLGRQARLSLLRRYLPQAFADRVSSDSIDLGAALKAQALEATLLVADLRGFTAMSEALSPAEVVDLLGGYHEAMLESVEANGGVVDKFLGDGILVVFGLPDPKAAASTDAGARSAVQCAASMLDRLARLNATRRTGGKPPLTMGIGIHTGPVIAGTIGAGRRREFTVIGDAVNTASRLEGLTKTAESPVLVSASTVARLGAEGGDGLRELPAMPIRGKAEPLRIYALERNSGLFSAARGG